MSFLQSIMDFISAKETANVPVQETPEEAPQTQLLNEEDEYVMADDKKQQYAEYVEKAWSNNLKDRSRRRRLMDAAKKARDVGNMNDEEYKKALDTFGEKSDEDREIDRQIRQYRKEGRITEKYTEIDQKTGEQVDVERDVANKKKKKTGWFGQ